MLLSKTVGGSDTFTFVVARFINKLARKAVSAAGEPEAGKCHVVRSTTGTTAEE